MPILEPGKNETLKSKVTCVKYGNEPLSYKRQEWE